jgi:hypothetical protein
VIATAPRVRLSDTLRVFLADRALRAVLDAWSDGEGSAVDAERKWNPVSSSSPSGAFRIAAIKLVTPTIKQAASIKKKGFMGLE